MAVDGIPELGAEVETSATGRNVGAKEAGEIDGTCVKGALVAGNTAGTTVEGAGEGSTVDGEDDGNPEGE